MSLIDQKKKVFGGIASLRTLTEGFPKLKVSSSMPSINNNGDTVTFLTDLIKTLIGYEALVEETVNILTYSTSDIEKEIKSHLKDELRSLINCGINPSIPDILKSTGSGITFQIKEIDFQDIMFINPDSQPGKLLFSDLTTDYLDSTDFNTFLYQVIQNNGTVESWGHTTLNTDILDLQFNSIDINGINPRNSIKVNTNQVFDNNSLNDLNSKYLDSISLFNIQQLINGVLDIAFAPITSALKTSKTLINNVGKIGLVIDKMVQSTTDSIEDKIFDFTDKELQKIERISDLKFNGLNKIVGSSIVYNTIPINLLTELNEDSQQALNFEDQKLIIQNGFNAMGNTLTEGIPKVDIPTVKLNFIQEIINNLTKALINTVISPKVVLIFMINYKIVYGNTATFNDGLDFIKKNKTLFHRVMKRTSEVLIKKLLTLALKKITELVAAAAIKEETEKAKSQVTQILSLIGIPQDILRLIKGI